MDEVEHLQAGDVDEVENLQAGEMDELEHLQAGDMDEVIHIIHMTSLQHRRCIIPQAVNTV
jgi:hypothetical protein